MKRIIFILLTFFTHNALSDEDSFLLNCYSTIDRDICLKLDKSTPPPEVGSSEWENELYNKMGDSLFDSIIRSKGNINNIDGKAILLEQMQLFADASGYGGIARLVFSVIDGGGDSVDPFAIHAERILKRMALVEKNIISKVIQNTNQQAEITQGMISDFCISDSLNDAAAIENSILQILVAGNENPESDADWRYWSDSKTNLIDFRSSIDQIRADYDFNAGNILPITECLDEYRVPLLAWYIHLTSLSMDMVTDSTYIEANEYSWSEEHTIDTVRNRLAFIVDSTTTNSNVRTAIKKLEINSNDGNDRNNRFNDYNQTFFGPLQRRGGACENSYGPKWRELKEIFPPSNGYSKINYCPDSFTYTYQGDTYSFDIYSYCSSSSCLYRPNSYIQGPVYLYNKEFNQWVSLGTHTGYLGQILSRFQSHAQSEMNQHIDLSYTRVLQDHYKPYTLALNSYWEAINQVRPENKMDRELAKWDGQDYLDLDGLSVAMEIFLGTDPRNPDTDGDGFDDRYERDNQTDPLDPTSN